MFSWQACQLGKMPRCSHWRHFTWRRPVFYHPAHGRESWALQEVPTVGQIGKQLASVTSVPTGKTEGEWYFHETNTARRINWFIHIIGEMPKFPVQIELVETTQKRHRNKHPPLNHLENIIHFPPFTNENPWASEKSRSINYPTVITRGVSVSQTLLVWKVGTTAGRALFRQTHVSQVLFVSSELLHKKWQLRWGVFSTWGSDRSVTPCWFPSRSIERASLMCSYGESMQWAAMVSLLHSAFIVQQPSNPQFTQAGAFECVFKLTFVDS